MSKIIKEGNPNFDKPWVGEEVECRRCNCTFILDENDKPSFHSDQHDGDYYEIVCPFCKSTVTFTLRQISPSDGF